MDESHTHVYAKVNEGNRDAATVYVRSTAANDHACNASRKSEPTTAQTRYTMTHSKIDTLESESSQIPGQSSAISSAKNQVY